jgi:hypothetical protein
VNPAAWQWLASCAVFLLGWAARDLWLYRRHGGPATISSGIRRAGPGLAFLIGYAAGALTWGLAVHFFFWQW